ncbi:Lnb N-terminal periplasmic domain-containing protein [Psychrobacter sp. AOP7-C1-14]|uniref:Lnb N-terminal periplasmic domain-containing protein n=1 Tax=Psychrobacter sp. AOP7-C1-14 TaxID=3457640 RepID=UPI00402BA91F
MSLRSVFSRLLSSRSRSRLIDSRDSESQKLESKISGSHTPESRQPKSKWRQHLVTFLITVTLLLSAIWLLLAIWYQYGISSVLTWLATIAIASILAALLSTRYWEAVTRVLQNNSWSNKKSISKGAATKVLIGIYSAVWLVGLGWFFSIEPKQDREWMAEVDRQVSYERDATNPDLITLTNVRNFDWQTKANANEHWDTRTIDLSKLSGVDVTNSYWMGPLIAHTLVSFRFEDDRPLAFSFEIRKEDGESFSALAGFFRRYELSLIAAEERDIIYTRSNARGEQVYMFPISNLQQHEVRSLFEPYLTAADDLNAEPAWYNTLVSNCTNIIFYMARIVSGDRLPWDYRIWVSGWLPNYLYDVGMLDAAPEKDNQPWSMNTWYERTHINPKARGFDNQADSQSSAGRDKNSSEFSQQIRQDIPIPSLANSQTSAEAKAKSTAQASD